MDAFYFILDAIEGVFPCLYLVIWCCLDKCQTGKLAFSAAGFVEDILSEYILVLRAALFDAF